VTEFSKTFPVFYKWPDLTNIQVVLPGTVCRLKLTGHVRLDLLDPAVPGGKK
jgi:hypothetical protein